MTILPPRMANVSQPCLTSKRFERARHSSRPDSPETCLAANSNSARASIVRLRAREGYAGESSGASSAACQSRCEAILLFSF